MYGPLHRLLGREERWEIIIYGQPNIKSSFFSSQHPVTYHMKTAHPGCGGHAGSKGYNSGGHYCGGWAGNCGDGGVGGSSWYGFCVLNFLSILSNFLSPEKLTQKIAEQLRKTSIFE